MTHHYEPAHQPDEQLDAARESVEPPLVAETPAGGGRGRLAGGC